MILKAVRYHKIGEVTELVNQGLADVLIIDNVESAFQMFDNTGSMRIDFTKNNEQTETLQITKVERSEDDCTTETFFNAVFLMNDKGETIERLV